MKDSFSLFFFPPEERNQPQKPKKNLVHKTPVSPANTHNNSVQRIVLGKTQGANLKHFGPRIKGLPKQRYNKREKHPTMPVFTPEFQVITRTQNIAKSRKLPTQNSPFVWQAVPVLRISQRLPTADNNPISTYNKNQLLEMTKILFTAFCKSKFLASP